MTPRVLVSDKLSPTAVQVFSDRGIEVDYQPDLGRDTFEVLEQDLGYDGEHIAELVIAGALE